MDRAVRKVQIAAWLKETTASRIGAGDGLSVYWRGEPMPVRPAVYAICYLPSTVGVGIDVREYEYDDAAPLGEEMRHFQTGQRRITLEVQIWSSRTSGHDDAGEYARRIVDRIRLTDWAGRFAAAGIAFCNVAGSAYAGRLADDRQHVLHQLDLVFNATSLEEGSPIGWIKTVDEAELQIPEGTEQWTGDIPVG